MRKLATGLLLLFCAAASFSAQSNPIKINNLDSLTDLSGPWHYQIGDDLQWASPELDHSQWPTIPVPMDWGKFGLGNDFEYLWYRKTLQFDPALLTDPTLSRLSINIGQIFSAYELYANGELIGGVGKLPPNSQVMYDRPATFAFPRSAIAEDGSSVIAIRVWREQYLFGGKQGGAGEGGYVIGTTAQIIQENLFAIVVPILLASIYLLVGINHLYLYRKNRKLTEYFWLGVMALSLSCYTVLISRWRDGIPADFWLLKQIEYTAIFATPMAATLFITNLLNYKPAKFIRFYQYSFLVFIFVTWFHPGLDCICSLVVPWQVWSLASIVVTPCFILLYAIKGNSEARIIFWGILIFTLTIANDILAVNRLIETPRLLPIGFLAIVLSMSFSLARRFTNSYSELETTVKTRTEELNEKNKELDQMAHIDPLTKTYNRRSFDRTAIEKVSRYDETHEPFWIALCDIDNFKHINDTYGHNVGDVVLAAISSTLKSQLREEDFLARWGGEEFIIILSDNNRDSCISILERLRDSIEALIVHHESLSLNVTITIGSAQYNGDMTLKDVIKSADDALYKGKEQGKNQVVFS